MGHSLSHTFTVTADTSTSRTIRLDIYYHSTAGINDTNNNFVVLGNWPNRSGAVNVQLPTGGGSLLLYSHSITIAKVFGATQTVAFAAELSGINYWGTTVAVNQSHVVPARPYEPPSAPGKPAISLITPTTARAAWTASSFHGGAAVTSYQMQLARNSTFTSGLSTVNAGTNLFFNIVGTTRATDYWVRVRAWNGHHWSAWSAVTPYRSAAVVPTISNSAIASSITRNSATITGFSVTDNGGEAPSNLRVQYNTSASESGASLVTRGAWAATQLSGLAASTEYFFRVAAYNSAGWSDYSAWKAFTTLSDAPDDIDELSFAGVSNTGMQVSWDEPNMNGATFLAYRYEVSLADTFTTLVASGTTSELFVDLAGLIPGTRYFVRVRTNASPNSSGWTEADQVTTGIAPNSGLRLYTFVDGVRKQLTPYSFIGGVRKQLRIMYAHDGVVETE